ncbi:MAG: hypothetical protein AAGD10_12075 [Myxococcota bacterium]
MKASNLLRTSDQRLVVLVLSTGLGLLGSACGDEDDPDGATDAGSGRGGSDMGPGDANMGCGMIDGDGTISLASEMEAMSRIAEFNLTGAQAQIGFGDGGMGDRDGVNDVNDPSIEFGSGLDIFPRETSFLVGSLSFDGDEATGCGLEVLPIDAYDLSEFFSDGEAERDLSDEALGNWLSSEEFRIEFGPVDEADVVSFMDGDLVGIDLEISVEVIADFSQGTGDPARYSGSLSVVGNQFSVSIDDTQNDIDTIGGVFPSSRLVFDLQGVVQSVMN